MRSSGPFSLATREAPSGRTSPRGRSMRRPPWSTGCDRRKATTSSCSTHGGVRLASPASAAWAFSGRPRTATYSTVRLGPPRRRLHSPARPPPRRGLRHRRRPRGLRSAPRSRVAPIHSARRGRALAGRPFRERRPRSHFVRWARPRPRGAAGAGIDDRAAGAGVLSIAREPGGGRGGHVHQRVARRLGPAARGYASIPVTDHRCKTSRTEQPTCTRTPRAPSL